MFEGNIEGTQEWWEQRFRDELAGRDSQQQQQQGDATSSGLSRIQYAVIYDLIAEGEIEGLVQGPASILLNGASLLSEDAYIERAAQGGDGTVLTGSGTGGTSSLTISGDLNTSSTTLNRHIEIEGAGKSTAGITFTLSANSNIITSNSSWFEAGMSAEFDTDITGFRGTVIQIFTEDGDYFTSYISDVDSATQAQLFKPSPVSGTYSGDEVEANLTTKITSALTSGSVTLADTLVSTVSGTRVIIGSGVLPEASSYPDSDWTYEGASASFFTGSKNQKYQRSPSQSSAASFLYNPQQALKQHSDFGGEAGSIVITPTLMGIANPEDIDKFKISIEGPSLISVSGRSGREYAQAVEVQVLFKYKPAGSASFTNDIVVIGRSNPSASSPSGSGYWQQKTKKPYIKEFRFDVEEYQPFNDWEITVKKVTGDSGEEEHYQKTKDTTLKAVQAQVLDHLNYRGTSYATVTYSAKDFSNPPRRSYVVRGKKIQVPTNYITREENDDLNAKYTRNVSTGADSGTEQDWDGNFRGDVTAASIANVRKVYCNNPAWVFYDILRNPVYGLGDYIDSDLIDIYSLYQIAQYCDELVPDGRGGQEPRFTTNVIIESSQEAYKILKDFATVFRGIMYWLNGQIVPIQDGPKEPVYTFTQGNVVDGLFTYEGQSDRVTRNRVNVTWRNPDKNYAKEVVVIDDLEKITEKAAILAEDIIAFGCTSRGQAYRAGKWYLETNSRENEVVKFETGSNGSFILPGDIINVQDQERSFVQFSGRISKEQDNVSASPTPDANTIHLDREVTLAAGSSYVLHVYFKGGAAYLVQNEDATVGGTTYSRGQLISSITSKEDAADATDDSGNRIQVYWTENGHIKSQEVDEGASSGNIIELVTGFPAVPDSDSIWALTTDGVNAGEDPDEVNQKQFRVLGIEETENGEYSIVASLYDISKYTLVDFGYPSAPDPNIGDPTYVPGYVPPPSEVGMSYAFSGATGTGVDAEEDTSEAVTTVATAAWNVPEERVPSEDVDATTTLSAALNKRSFIEIPVTSSASFKSGGGVAAILNSNGSVREFVSYDGTDTGKLTGVKRGYYTTPKQRHQSGATIEDRSFELLPYRFLSGFRVRLDSGSTESSFSNSLDYPGLSEGTYLLQVRSVNSKGKVSEWVTRSITIQTEKNRINAIEDRVSSFGSMDRIPQIDSSTGEVTISPAAFTIRNPADDFVDIPSVISLDYSSLVGGEEAYVYYDHSETATSPPNAFKEAELVTDNSWYSSDLTAVSSPFIFGTATWWAPLNDANNGLTTITGTITTTVNRSRIVGSGTSFLTDYSVGDLIRVSSVNTPGSFTTDAWYSRVESVESDTILYTREPVTKVFTGSFGFKQTIAPESNKDLLLSKVIATGSPIVYSIENLLSTNATDGVDAETVNLTASNYVAKYSNGSLIDSSPTNNITLTATPSAGLGSPTQYRFLNDAGSPVQDWSTDNDYVIPESGLPAENTSLTYKVEVTDGGLPFSFVAFDTVTIAAISDGLDGSPGTDGRPGLPGASRILPYDNLQSSLPNAAGQYAFLSGSTPTYVTSWADIKSAEVIQLRPFTDPLTTNQSQYYDQIKEGDVITYYITSGKWVDYVVDVNNGLTGSPGAYEFEVTALEFDETGGTADPSTADGVGVKFRFSRATEAIVGVLTNDTHAEAADSSGVLVNDLLDAGGNFLVFKGIQEVTNESPAPSFAVSSPSVVDGLEMTINSAGVYSLNGSPSEWTGDAAVFELTATYEGFTVVKKYSIVKTKEGAAGAAGSAGLSSQAVKLTSGRYAIVYDSTSPGNPVDTTAITLTADPVNFEASPAVEYRFLKNGSEVQAYSTTATYSITSGNFPGANSEDTYSVEAGSGGSPIEATDSVTIIGVQEGANVFTSSYNNSAHTVSVDALGVEDWTGSGGVLKVFEGATLLNLNTNTQTAAYPGTNSEYNLNIVKVSGDTITEPTITGAGTTEATLSSFSGNITQATAYRIDIYIKTSLGQEVLLQEQISLSPSFAGADGSPGPDGKPGLPGASTILIYDEARQGTETMTTLGTYKFSNSSNYAQGGTLTWSAITGGSFVTHFHMNDSDDFGVDQSNFLGQIGTGDVLTWYESDRRWVEFRITNAFSESGGIFTFAVTLVEFDENDGNGNLSGDPNLQREIRFSKASQGLSTAEVTCYIRAETTPGTPSNGTYNFATSTLSPPTSPDTWFTTIPEGSSSSPPGLPVYASKGTVSTFDNQATNVSVNWAAPTQILQEGATFPNLVAGPERGTYSNFDGVTNSFGNQQMSTDRFYIGDRSFKSGPKSDPALTKYFYTFRPDGTNLEDGHYIKITPGSRFLLGVYVNATTTDINVNMYTYYHDTSTATTRYTTDFGDERDLTAANTWERLWWELKADSTHSFTGTETEMGLSGYWESNGTTQTVWIDGLMLIDVTDFPQYTKTNPPPIGWYPPALSADAELTGSLSNDSHVAKADPYGNIVDTSYTNAGGTFNASFGIEDITGNGPNYTVESTSTVDGLTMSINSASGVYSLSGSNWTGEDASFTLRASYFGLSVDKIYSISKAVEGLPEKLPGIKWGDGSTSVKLKANTSTGGGANDGEIQVQAGSYRLPSGTARTVSADTEIFTPFESTRVPSDFGSKDEYFYVIWGASPSNARFPSASGGFGGAEANGLFTAIYNHNGEQWYATGNTSTSTANAEAFTPASGDRIVAWGYKAATSGGIEIFNELVAVVNDPEATLGANVGTTLFDENSVVLANGAVLASSVGTTYAMNQVFSDWSGTTSSDLDGYAPINTTTYFTKGTNSSYIRLGTASLRIQDTGGAAGYVFRSPNSHSPVIPVWFPAKTSLILHISMIYESYTSGHFGGFLDIATNDPAHPDQTGSYEGWRRYFRAPTTSTGVWQDITIGLSQSSFTNNLGGTAGDPLSNFRLGFYVGSLGSTFGPESGTYTAHVDSIMLTAVDGSVVDNSLINFATQGSGLLPTINGGTGLTSISTLQNTNVTTFETDKSPTVSWATFNTDTQISGPPGPYDCTITWRNGAGTSLGITRIRMNYSAASPDFESVDHAYPTNAATDNTANATVSFNTVNSALRNTSTATLNGITVTLDSTVVNGISWNFSK